VKFRNISGVILAGGANKRFHGKVKAKAVIGGKTIISRIIDTVSEVFSEIIIITNTPEEFIEFSNYKLAADQFLNAGPLGGIHAALKSSSNEAIFVFAGDMPLLDKNLIIRQIDFYNNSKCDILVPAIQNYSEPLHAIYNISILNRLEEYLSGSNDYAVREFFRRVDVNYLKLEDSEKIKRAFTNINSPSDILLVEKNIGDPLIDI
jgi:molybdopterin-guanine dinucleotide biosynthesis protein A